jgi:hypothetical protein
LFLGPYGRFKVERPPVACRAFIPPSHDRAPDPGRQGDATSRPRFGCRTEC